MLLGVRDDRVNSARQRLESIEARSRFPIPLVLLADDLADRPQALFMVGTLSWVGWVLDRRHFHIAL
jgi:hypothetical protein